jgi:hypothetical protein
MHTHCIHMDSCDTLKNILSANQLFSLIDVKRKFINSDNHKFHQYQENDYLSSSLNLSRRDCMVVEFTTTCAIVAYHHLCCEFEPHEWRGVLDKTLCDKSFSVTCNRSVVFSGYSNFCHKSSN